jgi:hypothetical protein
MQAVYRRMDAAATGDQAIEENERLYESLDPLDDEWAAIRKRLIERPVRTWSDVVDRALLALRCAERRIDDAWEDLQCEFSSGVAEGALAVLIMAGVTDGQIERNGDPNWQPTPCEVPDVNIDPVVATSFDGLHVSTMHELAAEFSGIAPLAAVIGCTSSQAKSYVSANWLPRGWFQRAETALAARGKTLSIDLLV